jgi:glyoxylase-like metal-dependent hydrolase (beta-lactamase superfamily II)
LAIVVVFGLCWTAPIPGQSQQADKEVETLQVRSNVYMIAGGGSNVAVHLGPEGAVVVDTGSEPMSDKVLAAIGRLSSQRIRYIINTSADPDHVGGNEKLARAGLTLFPGGGGGGLASVVTNSGGAAILAHDNVVQRMSAPTGEQSAFPTGAWPTESFTGNAKSLYLNDDGIQVIYQPTAHSDGDSIVFFRRADVIVTGDIFDTTRFPVIDTERGGTIQGEIDALNRLVDMAIPAVPLVWKEGRTMLIPGHGRISDQADLVEYRDMVTIIRDVIQDMVNRGMTLEQVKKADPTKGYRSRFGSDSGPWTTDMFVEAVYKSLSQRK